MLKPDFWASVRADWSPWMKASQADGVTSPAGRSDRQGDVVVGNRIRLCWKGRLEKRNVVGHGLDHFDGRGIGGHRHLNWVGDWAFRLLLDSGGPAIPELHKVPGGVVHGWRVALPLLVLEAGGDALGFRTIGIERMAGVTGDLLVGRKARIVVQGSADVTFASVTGLSGELITEGSGAKSCNASAFTFTLPDADRR